MTHENQFTPRAEEALRLAQEAAEEMGHGYVGCEHILLGLMREEDGIAHRVMQEYGMTQSGVAERVGKSRPAVANALRLLSLGPAVLELVKDGALSAGHARALLPVKDEAQQLSLAQKVMALGLSVRQTEALCKKLSKQAQPAKPQPPQVDYLAECEKELTAGLGRKVRIVSGKRKGRIELEYYGQEDLQQLYDALQTIRKKEHH